MRINKFLLMNYSLKIKILILLFSFVFNIFMPTFLACRGRLSSGGQLSFAVIPENKKQEKKNRKNNKKNLSIESLQDNINNSANLDISIGKLELAAQEKQEIRPDLQVTQKEQAAVKIKTQDEFEDTLLSAPEKIMQEQVSSKTKQVSQSVSSVDTQLQSIEKIQEPEKSGLKIDLQKIAAPETKNLRRILKFPTSENNLLDPAGQQKMLAESIDKIDKDDEETVVFNFEDVDLANVSAYVEMLFNVKFITDEAISPMAAQNAKALSGNKVSFKTQKPLLKKQAWSLFVTFLNMAGFALVPMADKKFYRITLIAEAKKSSIPVYINTDNLPDSGIIRYGYFVKDCPLDTIKSVIESLKGSSADLLMLNDHNAFIITDDAYNIKILMKIVKELDRVTMPQTMSVLRLYKGEASYAKDIYEKLISEGENSAVAARLFGPKTASKTLYFPKKAKVIVDDRTNSLILLGTIEAIQTIEDFVRKYIDVDIDAPYSPLYIYDLKYANASDVANLMNNLVKFGDQKQAGAVRAGDKYFKNMTFTPEQEGNRIIVRGDYDDYLKAKDIIDQIDEAPKQIAVEILILSIEVQDQKQLGAQIRNQFKSPDGTPLNFQTSGITLGSSAKPIVLNQNNIGNPGSGAFRLLGDLINLVTGSTAGTTAISLGSDKYGVWGIFGILDTITNTQVVANPFLTVTNNTKANVKLGETERVVTANVVGQQTTQAFTNYDAFIDVTVTPKINSDGMIVTELTVLYDDFILGSGGVPLSKNTRKIQTTVVLSNNEILALGGLLKNRTDDAMSQVPILGKIPIIGWLFKNKSKSKVKDDLLILINAHIIDPTEKIKENTKRHLKEYRDTIAEFDAVKTTKDPVDRAFFKDKSAEFKLDNYLFSRGSEDRLGRDELGAMDAGVIKNVSQDAVINKEFEGKKSVSNRRDYRRNSSGSKPKSERFKKVKEKKIKKSRTDKNKKQIELENKRISKEAKKASKNKKASIKEVKASRKTNNVAKIAASSQQLGLGQEIDAQKIEQGRKIGQEKLQEIKKEIELGA